MSRQWDQGFYKLSPEERRKILTQQYDLTPEEGHYLTEHESRLGNELVENYITDYALPEGVLTNLVVNGKQYTVPMVVEEPSVIAAANNGAKRVANSGGFQATNRPRMLTGQVVLENVQDPQKIIELVEKEQATLLQVANAAHPSMEKRGGGAKKINCREAGQFISVDVYVDVCQAMGANTVNTMAEAVAHWFREQGYDVLTAILSNYALDSLQTVTCEVAFADLATKTMSGEVVAQRIADMSSLAAVDVYRAVTNNKGIMNGIDAALIASGNDWRAIESGAHAYASQNDSYRGLSTWRLTNTGLTGELTLPMPVGVVGGSIGLNELTRINYKISQIKTARELAAVVVSLGLAQNLAALRALATTGIQAGHMQLQYRSLALSVGASPVEVDKLVGSLSKQTHVDQEVAKKMLNEIRKESSNE